MTGHVIPGDEPRPEPPAAMTGADAAMPGLLLAGQDPPGADTHPPGTTGRRPRRHGRNDLIRRARLAIPSPSGTGRPMSRQELADAVNAYLHARGVRAQFNQDLIGRYERGDSRWPRAHYRRGLRAVLDVETDAQLGLFKPHRRPSEEEPWRADEPSGDPVAVAAANSRVTGAIAPPVVSLPGPSRRVVLHWTGSKADALRIAMRMSVDDFAAKLGLAATVVHRWRQAGGLLRYETHQMLDAMLSMATDDDVLRFDLALQEIGEGR